jgi:SagB-type dehydrogenase family enzyme
MKEIKVHLITGISLFAFLFGGVMCTSRVATESNLVQPIGENIELPDPFLDSPTSIEQALSERRSVRDYSNAPLTLAEISQLLWAAQGITHPSGYRTAPSAGALYPLEVYLVAGNVEDLPAGVYLYDPEKHLLKLVSEGDIRSRLADAALGQEPVENAAAVIVIAAVYERTTGKYGDRGIRYVHMEVGSAAQNIYLQAVSLDLGTVFIGAFDDEEIKKVVGLQDQEQPLCIMPVGRK